MDAIVTAGGVPGPDDPLYPITQGRPKALIPILGRPMVAYVLDALLASGRVDQLVVAGLPQDSGADLPGVTAYLPPQAGMLENVEAGLAWLRRTNGHAEYAALCSSDIPLITPEAIAYVLDAPAQHPGYDLYYTVVEKSVMEARFPGSRRTYARIKEGAFSGGDLNVLRINLAETRRDLWQKLIAARKSPLRQAELIGLWPLVKFVTRRFTIADAERLAVQVGGMRGRVVISPYPELAMDVDKPGQLAIIEAELAQRVGSRS
jgi:hypothetical protein